MQGIKHQHLAFAALLVHRITDIKRCQETSSHARSEVAVRTSGGELHELQVCS